MNNIRNILDILEDIEDSEPQVGDIVEMECGDTLIETTIAEVTEDGVVLHLDETGVRILVDGAQALLEGKTGPGLWANIHDKRQRGERMRKRGEEGAPTEKALKAARAGSKNEGVTEGTVGAKPNLSVLANRVKSELVSGNLGKVISLATEIADDERFPFRSFADSVENAQQTKDDNTYRVWIKKALDMLNVFIQRVQKDMYSGMQQGVAEDSSKRGLNHAYEIHGNRHGYYVWRKSPASEVLNIGTDPNLTGLTGWDPMNSGVQNFVKRYMKPVNFSSLSPEHQMLVKKELPLQKVAQRPQQSAVTPTQAAFRAKKAFDRSLRTTRNILHPTTQNLYQIYKDQLKKAKGVAEAKSPEEFLGQIRNMAASAATKPSQMQKTSKFDEVYDRVEVALMSASVVTDDLKYDIERALKSLEIKPTQILIDKLDQELYKRHSQALDRYNDLLGEGGVPESRIHREPEPPLDPPEAKDDERDEDWEYERYRQEKLDNEDDEDDDRKERSDEAKYRGREVPLGKPMAGDVAKRKVYVKGPKGNVVKVNFGQKGVKIKKNNPARRKSFRARHNCDNPGPRWRAKYWSCRMW